MRDPLKILLMIFYDENDDDKESIETKLLDDSDMTSLFTVN